ncbi:HIT family protein [Clostridium perfringens]|uniref:HIT family protein n=1 Tax=Clostridium perfringens TaxID=1502 RepID=UPI002A27B4B9|nr:HIT family protein [Clostridium perfringens]
MECIFCKIVNKEIDSYIIYEDKDLISFLDIDPINEGHILIIPKKHYLDADELPDKLLCNITLLSKKILIAIKKIYNPDGYSIMQNGGKFNDIGHYHMHLFPRYIKDNFSWIVSDKNYNVNEIIANKIKENI